MPIAITPDQLAWQASIRDWAKQAGLLSLGGDGLGVLDTAVLLTEMGRHATPDCAKALATLMTGALPVVRWGDEDLQRALLPGVASGEWLLTAALREPSTRTRPSGHSRSLTENHRHQSRRPLRRRSAPHPHPRPPPLDLFHDRGQFEPNSGQNRPRSWGRPRGAGAEGAELTRTPSSSGRPEYTLRLDQAPVESVLGERGASGTCTSSPWPGRARWRTARWPGRWP